MAHALVLASGRLSGRLKETAPAELKALMPFAGKPVLARVLDALHRATAIEEVVVIGPKALREAVPVGEDVRWLEEGPSKPENLHRGLRGLGLSTPVVILAGDLPFLTAEGVDTLIDALPQGVDLGVPIITGQEFRGAFAAAPSREVRLSDGTFVQPATVIAKSQAILMNYDLVLRAYALRRRVLRVMRLLGWRALATYLSGHLTTDRLCATVTGRLGAPCMPLPGMPPELAFRLSDPSCYEVAQRRGKGDGQPAEAKRSVRQGRTRM